MDNNNDAIVIDCDIEAAKSQKLAAEYRAAARPARKAAKAAKKAAVQAKLTTVIGEAMTVAEEVKKMRPKKFNLADSWLWACWARMPVGDRLDALKLHGFHYSTGHSFPSDNPDKAEFWFYRPGLDCWGGHEKSLDAIFSKHHAISLL